MDFLFLTFDYITSLTTAQLLTTFWFFIFFDFTRYLVLDVIGAFIYAKNQYQLKPLMRRARTVLFQEKPLVSVLVPGKNEGKNLYKLALSLRLQTFKNLEVIVVDDGSDDASPYIARHLLKRGLIHNFFRNEERGGKASAANLALLASKGKYIVHLDADSNLRKDAIEKMLVHFYLDPNVGGVGGDIRVNNLSHSVCTTMQSIEYLKTITVARTIASSLGILRIISGAYGAFSREALVRTKGWEVGPGLDGDITIRLRKLGYKVVHEPAAVCYTNVPENFKRLAKQRYRWDRSLVRFRIRKHSDLLNIRNKNFSWLNFFTIADNLLFSFVLNLKWWVYFVQLLVFYPETLHYILTINFVLYLTLNIGQFALALWLIRDTITASETKIKPFILLAPVYSTFFLRPVRTYAHIMELLYKASYFDKWNPWKVSSKQLHKKRDKALNKYFEQ